MSNQTPTIFSWRPSKAIRLKVIAIALYRDALLVLEVLDDNGNLKGWCPLGGGVEFGETASQALKREILEELNCSICIQNSPPTVFENIFEHHGHTGHEIILAFSVTFDNTEIYEKKRFQIEEVNGNLHWAEWINLEHFKSSNAILFPAALLNHLIQGSI